MDIPGISASLPFTPAPQSRSSADNVNLAAIRSGNADALPINPADFGGPESDQRLLQQLSLGQQNLTSPSRLTEKLRELQILKKSSDPAERMEAIQEFGRLGIYRNEQARSIGTAGLINLIYTSLDSVELAQGTSLLLLILIFIVVIFDYQ